MQHTDCIHLNESSTAKVRLFCFPYAGGSTNIFRTWHQTLPETIEICGVQLPGRMNLTHIEPYTDMLALVNYLQAEIRPYLLDKPFVFFGHSLGGLVAFELARYLFKSHRLLPEQLIISGCKAPNKKRLKKDEVNLTEHEIIKMLRKYNGTPLEVLENEELMQLMMPVFLADFSINKNYNYLKGSPLDCPITAYGGIDDLEISQDDLHDWCYETSNQFQLHMIPGGHFFIEKPCKEFLHLLARNFAQKYGVLWCQIRIQIIY